MITRFRNLHHNNQNRLRSFCSLVAVLCAISVGVAVLPAHADDGSANFKAGLAAYNAGKYQLAIASFEMAALVSPGDARVQYCLGNCHAKSGNRLQAIACYQRVLTLNSDAQTANLARTALHNWQVAPAGGPTDYLGRNAPVAVQSELDSRISALTAEAQKDLLGLKKTYDNQVATANERLKLNLACVVKGAYNPNYKDGMAQIKEESARELAILKENYDRAVAERNAYYQKRQQELTDTGSNLRSAYAQPSKGSLPVGRGSGLYNRNYLNQSGIDEPESTATAAAQSGINDRRPPVKIDQQSSERARLLSREADAQIANITATYNRNCASINEKLDSDIQGVPDKYYVKNHSYVDPSYAPTIAALKAEVEQKLNALKDDYDRRVKEISSDLANRQKLIAGEGNNVKAMYAQDSGYSRMMPRGSDFYTRNYLNQSGIDDIAPGQSGMSQSTPQPLPPSLSAVARPIAGAKPLRRLPPSAR